MGQVRTDATRGRGPRLPPVIAVWLAALLAQLPLVLNPGYLSHDELQWAVYAERGVAVAWLDLDTFQYRPLTFHLWMALSRALFEHPQAFHLVHVAWGSANAALLFSVARRAGLALWPAALGALAFALGPYAVYVHGWVATIADLAWVGAALAGIRVVQQAARWPLAAAAGAMATAAGLLGKEAALAVPALFAVAWLFDARDRRWAAAALGAGAVAALYLALRLDVLLDAPGGTQYGTRPGHAPLRWLEYQLFLPIVPLFEPVATLARPKPALLAAGFWLALVAALWRAGPRHAAFFLLGGLAALAPVLPLGASWNQYGYGFSALAAMAVAAAWPASTRAGRIAIAVFAALTLLHGAAVMLRMHEIGRIQAQFSPQLAARLRAHAGPAPLRLRLDTDAKPWVFARLTHQIPAYDGVPIGDRVRVVGAGEPADLVVAADGRLRALR